MNEARRQAQLMADEALDLLARIKMEIETRRRHAKDYADAGSMGHVAISLGEIAEFLNVPSGEPLELV